MQAILTKYLPPTNFHGGRIKVKAQRGSIMVHWDYALDVDANHDKACEAALKAWGWRGTWRGGGLPDGTGNAYVMWAEPDSDSDSPGSVA
jgi:hypothetical protein